MTAHTGFQACSISKHVAAFGGHHRHPELDLEVWFRLTADRHYTMYLRQDNVTQSATRSG